MNLKRGDRVCIQWSDSSLNTTGQYTDSEADALRPVAAVSVGQVAAVNEASVTLALTKFWPQGDDERTWRQVTTIPRFAIQSIRVLREG